MNQSITNPPEQVEQITSPKDQTPSATIPPDQSCETPHSQKKLEIMKDPTFLSSPIYPPLFPSKSSLSTSRDVHYYQLFLTLESFSKHNSLLFLCIQQTTRPNSMIKIKTGLDNGKKLFSLHFNFLCPSVYHLKTDENDPSFCVMVKKILIIL